MEPFLIFDSDARKWLTPTATWSSNIWDAHEYKTLEAARISRNELGLGASGTYVLQLAD